MGIRRIPARRISLTSGLTTQYAEEATALVGCTKAINVDTFAQFGSLGKVPGTVAMCRVTGYTNGIYSLHQHEFTDVSGVRRKVQLMQATNGTVSRLFDVSPPAGWVPVDGTYNVSATFVSQGGKNINQESTITLPLSQLRSVQMNDLLLLSGEYYYGLTGGVKYDGTLNYGSDSSDTQDWNMDEDGANIQILTNWGVAAPGSEGAVTKEVAPINVIDSGGWAATGVTGTGTMAVDYNLARSRTGAITFGKHTTGGSNFGILARPSGSNPPWLTLDLSVTAANPFVSTNNPYLYIWLFVPRAGLRLISDQALAVRCVLSDDDGVYKAFYNLLTEDGLAENGGKLREGWNLLRFNPLVPQTNAAQDGPGAGVDLDIVNYVEFYIVARDSGSTWRRRSTSPFNATNTGPGFAWSGWHGRPGGYITGLAAGGGNGVEAGYDYRYRYTHESKYGVESNAGPISATITPAKTASQADLDIGATFQREQSSANYVVFTGIPANNDTVTIGTNTYTWKTALTPAAWELLRGASTAACVDTLANAINREGTPGTEYANTTPKNPDVYAISNGTTTCAVYALVPGTAGNSIAIAESGANTSILLGGGFLTGGTDADTVTIDGKVYTCTDGPEDFDGSFRYNASAATCRSNLRKAINLEGSPGVDYGESTTVHPTVSAADIATQDLRVTAKVAGTVGNSITVSASSGSHVWSGSNLSGGKDDESVTMTVPVSPENQVVRRNIYRDLGADNIFRYVGSIQDNFSTTFVDTTPYASLGNQPPIAGDDEFDSSPPPRMKSMCIHAGRVFGIVADNPSQVVWSDPGQPEKFPLLNTFYVEESLEAILPHAIGRPLIYGTDKVYILDGDGVNVDFQANVVNTNVGCNGPDAAIQFRDLNLVMRESEVFLVSSPGDEWLLSQPVYDRLRAFDKSLLDQMKIVHDRGRMRVVFFPIGTSPSDEQPLVYQYGTMPNAGQVTGDGPGVSPQDSRMGKWFELALPAAVTPIAAVTSVEIEGDERPFLMVAGADGALYALNHPDRTGGDIVYPSTATDVSTTLKTSPIPLGLAPGGMGEVRYLQLNLEGSSAGAITYSIKVDLHWTADGDATPHATTTITYTAPTAGPQTPILAVPSMGRGRYAVITITDSDAQSNTKGIASLDLFYIPKRSFMGEQPVT